MPLPPPTRPHSANPQVSLRPSIFASSTDSLGKPKGQYVARNISTSYGHREGEWEDAWDSSSDTEDQPSTTTPPLGSSSSPEKHERQIPMPRRHTSVDVNGDDVISSSWASASYHHVPSSPASTTSPASLHRPQLSSSKSFTDGATPPAPGTHLENDHKRNGSASRSLPPGGAWEIVEPAELKEEVPEPPAVAGKEAVREDIEEILKGELENLV